MFLQNPSRLKKLEKDFKKLDQIVYQFMVDNFFQPLKIKKMRISNLNHIMDACVAYRTAFYSIGFYDLVDELNYCLDNLAEFLPEFKGQNRYRYKDDFYRKPKKENLHNFYKSSILSLEMEQQENNGIRIVGNNIIISEDNVKVNVKKEEAQQERC